MSVIRKKPFIEDLIEDLSDEQKSDLLDVMNGAGNTVDASFTNMPVDAISSVLFKLENNNLKTGILVQSENYNVLLAYHRFQDMQIFKLDTDKFTFEKVNEYLDINELRRVLAAGNETGGGGSGGSDTPVAGGSGKLYDITFDLSLYDQNSDIVKWSSNLIGIQNADSLRFSLLIYESNFERFKTKFNALAQQMSLTISIDEPQDLVNIFNTAFNQTTTPPSADAATLLMLTIQYVDRCLVYGTNNIQQFYVTGYVGLATTLGFIGTSGIEKHSLVDYDAQLQTDILYGLNTNNSCTLTEYGTSASGSVEAEPIVSIKMTNLDGATTDVYANGTILYDVQLYCTKDRWNEFVAYAKQMYDVDVTYSNFGTVFANSNAVGQLMFFMMMLNGYYEDKKIFPPFYITSVDDKIHMSLVSMRKGQYGNYPDVPILTKWYKGVEQAEIFPSTDRTDVPYTTQNTVITVEEIEGASIGASGGSSGSGTSNVLYKHSIVVYLQGDTQEEEPSPVQFNFLSKYAEPFVTDGSLADFITAFTAKNDFQAVIQPSLNEINGPSGFYVSNIVIDDTKITLLSAVNNNTNYTFGFKFVDNTSGITDTVIPYIQVSGGSGSDTTASQYDYVQMCFGSSNSSHIVLMFDKQYSRADDIPPQVNQLITTLNQMSGLSIPAYTDLESLADIADYLNVLDTQTYVQVKVIFWASVFSLYPHLCLSIKGYNNGMVVPVIVEGIADMGNQNFAYTIKMMDNTGAMVTEADEQTVFDFDIFVNELD